MMRALFSLMIFGGYFHTIPLWAGPSQVTSLIQNWEMSSRTWLQQVNQAQNSESRATASASQPDVVPVLKAVGREISPALDPPWTLEGMAWVLRAAPSATLAGPDGNPLPACSQEISTIRKALLDHHLRSEGLQPVCLALTASPDPQSLAILEKIEASHPDSKTRGVAALAVSLVLKSIGDSPEIMRKRLTALRTAIIESADVMVNDTSVAAIAENELYIIRYLTKGRTAPDLQGSDAAGRPMRLSSSPSKTQVLFFWSSTMPEAERVLKMMTKLHNQYRERGASVTGVNLDPVATLREAEGRALDPIPWKSFSDPEGKLAHEYRVGSVPAVFVLDAKRNIHFAGLPGSFVDLTVEALLSE